MGVGEHGHAVGADLVRGVAVGGDAVGAHHHEVDLAPRHDRRGRHVGDDGVGDSLARQFPRGEPRPLEHGPRLPGPHRGSLARVVGGAHDAEGGAVADGRERSRVAVCEHARAGGDELGSKPAERAVGGDVGGRDALRLREGGIGTALLPRVQRARHAPRQVRSGGPGGGEAARRRPHAGLVGGRVRGECHAERAGGAERGRAPHRE